MSKAAGEQIGIAGIELTGIVEETNTFRAFARLDGVGGDEFGPPAASYC